MVWSALICAILNAQVEVFAEPAVEAALSDTLDTTASDESSEDDDLLDMDIDQLAQADVVVQGDSVLDDVVSTVSRTETSVRKTPSAVYVVTNEMIRRSGARNLMEVLRED